MCQCINKNHPVVFIFQRPVGALIDAAETEAETHTLYHKVPAALFPFTHTIMKTFSVNHLLRECLNALLNVVSVIYFFIVVESRGCGESQGTCWFTPAASILRVFYPFQQANPDESGDHHFRKPANDITSQLEINFGDLGRPGRGRGGARGGRGGRGGGGSRTARGGGRSEKVTIKAVVVTNHKGFSVPHKGFSSLSPSRLLNQ